MSVVTSSRVGIDNNRRCHCRKMGRARQRGERGEAAADMFGFVVVDHTANMVERSRADWARDRRQSYPQFSDERYLRHDRRRRFARTHPSDDVRVRTMGRVAVMVV